MSTTEQTVTDVTIIHFITYTMHLRSGPGKDSRTITSRSDQFLDDGSNDYRNVINVFNRYCDTDRISLPFHVAELDTTIEQIDYIIPLSRMLPTI